MKSYREELTFDTKTRRAYINITPQVEQCLEESGVREGLALVPQGRRIFAPLTVRENLTLGARHDPAAGAQHVT